MLFYLLPHSMLVFRESPEFQFGKLCGLRPVNPWKRHFRVRNRAPPGGVWRPRSAIRGQSPCSLCKCSAPFVSTFSLNAPSVISASAVWNNDDPNKKFIPDFTYFLSEKLPTHVFFEACKHLAVNLIFHPKQKLTLSSLRNFKLNAGS